MTRECAVGAAQRFLELNVRRAPLDDFLHALRETLESCERKKGRSGPVRWEEIRAASS